MGRPKGVKNKKASRHWSKKVKQEYVQMVISGEYSANELGKENGISGGMIRNWVKAYLDGGIEALENKRKPGNPLVKYQNKKQLTELEQMEYEIMKLKIENERLKKGYTEKEVMAIRRKRQSKKNIE